MVVTKTVKITAKTKMTLTSGLKLLAAILVVATLLTHGSASGSNHDPNYYPGRDVMVHLFEWRWVDIAEECQRFLAPMGYAGVQVSPPNENAVISNDQVKRPWYERYQPVSYKLTTRSGTEEEFRDMVHRCNEVGVRIYVDVVANHMTGDLPLGTVGTAGSQFDSEKLLYPEVPYGPGDFNSAGCPTWSGNIENYGDANQVRNCKLVKLKDLNQGSDYVRTKIAEYMNNLLSIGVAGFRMDAAKHMWPGDLELIYAKLNDLSMEYFPPGTKPFIYQEVIDLGGEGITTSEYVRFGRVTEFKYGMQLANAFRGKNALKWFQTFGSSWGLAESDDALVFVDNHDNQRGHGAGGQDILTFFDPDLYKKAVAFTLAWPFGLKRVMSSYYWDRNFQNGKDINDWVGPPHDSNYNTLPVVINQNGSCGNGWVCEHRWPEIAQMVRLSIVSQGQPMIRWWSNENNQIAFSRGQKSFLAINNDNYYMSADIQTELPPGLYCDIASGIFTDSTCTGRLLTVRDGGMVYVNMPNNGNATMALHVEATLEFQTAAVKARADGNSSWERTVVMVQYPKIISLVGQGLFIRGGVSADRRPSCIKNQSECAVPIKHIKGSGDNDPWTTGDNYLDWAGKEDSQDSPKTGPALGTPLFQTFHLDPVWTMDVLMDCSKTDSGWFEFKVFNGEWERDITQWNECNGRTYRAQKPFPTTQHNHMALCGRMNKFTYASDECFVADF